jgi:hypothetical protein
MSAEIEAHNSMILGGHGAALIGYVLSGTARAGQTMWMPAFGNTLQRRLVVSAVERLSTLERSVPAVGLIFVNPPRLEELSRLFPPGSVFTLED